MRWMFGTALLMISLVANAQQLTVSAAASLGEAFREIARGFESARPGVTVRFNFAASGALVQHLRQGAPVDVLACADQESMDRALALALIDAPSRRDFTSNTLVLVAPPRDLSPPLRSMADLVRTDVQRIAIGKPESVPAGRYAQQALEAAKLWTPLMPKYVYADSVRQALDYVARGEVEAAFVYRTDALLLASKLRIVQTLDGRARYPVAVVQDSAQKALAQAFVSHLQGVAAQQTLARFGFGKL